MPIPDSPGVKFIDRLKYGINDLGWQQEEAHRYRAKRDYWMATASRGLIVPRTPAGDLTPAWSVEGDNATGRVRIRTAAGVGPWFLGAYPAGEESVGALDDDGVYFEFVNDFGGAATPWLLEVPDDNTWYTLVVRRVRTHAERGTLTVSTGSAVVTGTDTEFTRWLAFTDDGTGRGAKLRIPDTTELPRVLGRGGSALGSNGTHEVDQVVSDTQLILRDPVLGTNEAGLVYYIEGDFQGTPPTAPDGDVHWYDRAEFELVARTVEPAAGDLILCDVRYDTGAADPALQIIDRRMSNVARPTQLGAPGIPVFEVANVSERDSTTTTGGMVSAHRHASNAWRISASFGTQLESVDMAPMSNGWLAVVQSDTAIRAKWMENLSSHAPGTLDHLWTDPGGVTVNVDNAGTARHVALIQVPQPDDQAAGSPAAATHICFYTKSNVLYRRFTTDNGATWSTEASIWSPPTLDAGNLLSDVSAIFLQCGRIIVIAAFFDNTLTRTEIRYITSDDLGASWSINANAGTTWSGGADDEAPSIWQDDLGRIHTAWIRPGSPGEVIYEASISPYGLERVGGGTTHLGVETPLAYGFLNSGRNQSALWADAWGSAVVLYADAVGAGNPRQIHAYNVASKVDDTAASGVSPAWVPNCYGAVLQVADDPYNTSRASLRLRMAAGGPMLVYIDPQVDRAMAIPCKITYQPSHLGFRLL